MPCVEFVVGADGSFAAVIDGKMRNAKLDRDTGKTEWISFPKGPKHASLREAYEEAAKTLVGLLPRV
jgi:hypothetical protein